MSTFRKIKRKCKKLLEGRKNKNLVEGTDLGMISRDTPIRTNTSGVIGVCWDNVKNKWVAQIDFQGEHIYLGRFLNKEDAIKARKEAEEKLFKPILEKYERSNDKND